MTDPEPAAWWAETGTAGRGEGCNRPFWMRQDAIAYVQAHGGYIKPLFDAAPSVHHQTNNENPNENP